MIRRLPVIPTVIVLAAVATMIAFGFWQIRRAHEKEALLADLASAAQMPAIAFPDSVPADATLPLFRIARGNCIRVRDIRTSAGTNRSGESGFVFISQCDTNAAGGGMSVELGWSKNPQATPSWAGGPVEGMIAPDRKAGMRLVSATGLGGLQASAPPSIEAIPNNHRSYAVQWFLFAGIALLIYVLAVRSRLRREAAAL